MRYMGLGWKGGPDTKEKKVGISDCSMLNDETNEMQYYAN